MSDDRLEQAIELAQSGKAESARKLLELIIKDDRNNIPAWQWYAETWPKVSDKIRVWEVCLRYNPSNLHAQQALDTLALNQGEKEPRQPVKTMDPSGPESTFGGTNSSQWLLWGSIGLFIVVAVIAVLIIRNSKPITVNAAEYRHTQPVEYYLYVPKAYAADQEWPLFVGIHGAGGSGMDCWNLWQSYADTEGFILLCPSVPGNSAGFHLDVGETTVWSAIGELKKEYRVKPRMFFTGFSAGAFFIQGFTYHYPSYVSGLSILSSGVYLDPNLFAEVIPMVVVIGDQDNASAVQTSQIFVKDLRQFGFDIQYELMPGVGHTVTKKGIDLTIDLFRKIKDR